MWFPAGHPAVFLVIPSSRLPFSVLPAPIGDASAPADIFQKQISVVPQWGDEGRASVGSYGRYLSDSIKTPKLVYLGLPRYRFVASR